MDWKQLLVYLTGSADQELLVRNEYLVTENHILRPQITGRVRLSDSERKTLAELGKKLGRKALEEVATIVDFSDHRCCIRDITDVSGTRAGGCQTEGSSGNNGLSRDLSHIAGSTRSPSIVFLRRVMTSSADIVPPCSAESMPF
jgi:hypothetical protein